MFVIRSAFWLTIVFTSIPWTADALRSSPRPSREAATAGGLALGLVIFLLVP